jgi:BirA family biotin operon repressor/biotin-[acetyl-CoA-carboxylase] ligase
MKRFSASPARTNVIWMDDLDSTNAFAERLAESWLEAQEDRLPETLLVARRQSAGRGRGAHGWASPEGGLYATWLAWLPAHALATLPMALGVSLAAAAESLVPGVRIGLKWPNDLVAGDRKLGGVLCTSRSNGDAAWVSAGFGLNVVAEPALPADERVRPVSLTTLGFRGTAAEGIWALVAGFLERIHPALADPQGTRTQWIDRSVHRSGELMRIRVSTGSVEGRFVGFGPAGELEIDVGGRVRRYSAAELSTGDADPGG